MMIGQFLYSNDKEIFYIQQETSVAEGRGNKEYYISFLDLEKVKPGTS